MRWYIACSWLNREQAMILKERLESMGEEVTSRWITQHGGSVPMEQAGAEDVFDVQAADRLVELTGDSLTKGGRHTEFGIALNAGKPIHLIGPRENVFHFLSIVRVHPDMEDFLKWMEGIHELRQAQYTRRVGDVSARPYGEAE